ncbi:hypothetical protein GSI_07740 [Ganoderma sinense ZZ0214-1]|uniref:Hydrophobin n=1 Tax=Ganoderma sinense ZZ0214-1 TaxID=1077348 RepID=A0A2G8S8Q9_9APHY|nr:hypothetical protein GSI_07740 [Ganoderma sinense ZZ0214-1]
MQLTFDGFVKLIVFAVVANTVTAVVALPEPVGLEARQTLECLASVCNPSAADGCCADASCTGVSLLGIVNLGLCTPKLCTVICSSTSDCCTNIPNANFTCQLASLSALGTSIGVCVPTNVTVSV